MRSISGSLMPAASGVRRSYAATLRQSRFRMRWVAEPDYLDGVFHREIGEADLAVLRPAQLRVVGLGGVLDVVVQGRRNRDEIAFVIEHVVDHALGDEMSRQSCCSGLARNPRRRDR